MLEITPEPNTTIVKKSDKACDSKLDGDFKAISEKRKSKIRDKRVEAIIIKNLRNFFNLKT